MNNMMVVNGAVCYNFMGAWCAICGFCLGYMRVMTVCMRQATTATQWDMYCVYVIFVFFSSSKTLVITEWKIRSSCACGGEWWWAERVVVNRFYPASEYKFKKSWLSWLDRSIEIVCKTQNMYTVYTRIYVCGMWVCSIEGRDKDIPTFILHSKWNEQGILSSPSTAKPYIILSTWNAGWGTVVVTIGLR